MFVSAKLKYRQNYHLIGNLFCQEKMDMQGSVLKIQSIFLFLEKNTNLMLLFLEQNSKVTRFKFVCQGSVFLASLQIAIQTYFLLIIQVCFGLLNRSVVWNCG